MLWGGASRNKTHFESSVELLLSPEGDVTDLDT